MDTFDPKSPEEKDTFAFLFTPRLWKGETIVTCAVEIKLAAGTDADLADVQDGVPYINASDLSVKTPGGVDLTLPAKSCVLQSIKAGKDSCDYEVIASAVTSTGRVLSKHMILPVRNEGS